MKKLSFALAVILALTFLVSCSGDKKTVENASQTEAPLPKLKAAEEVSLAPLAEALKDSGLLGENTTYLTMGDEYTEDVLDFTYGLEEFRALNLKNCLVSEHGSNEAYTCAVLLFGDDFQQSSFELLSSGYEEYAKELQSSVAPYNPEAANLCGKYLVRRIEIKGENGIVYAVCLFISENNNALDNLVTEKLTAILKAD